MNVRQLRELLEDLDENIEIRLMIQQAWPFECSVRGAITDKELISARTEHDADKDWEHLSEGERKRALKAKQEAWAAESNPEVLYLLEGSQLGYGDKIAWEGR
jgi:hypothetical protein